MATEVEHWPASGSIFLKQPVSRIVNLRIERLEGIYLGQHREPDFTRLNYLLCAFDHWIEMAVVRDPKLHLVQPTSRDHAIAFTRIHRHWLFAQHMFSRFRSGDRLPGMQMDRGGDVNGDDFLITD